MFLDEEEEGNILFNANNVFEMQLEFVMEDTFAMRNKIT